MEHRVAIVLSGGGAKGAYEAGALLPIVRRTKAIHIVTGASIGAINASIFACTYDETGDMLKAAEAVKNAWYKIGRLFKLDLGDVAKKAFFSGVRSFRAEDFLSFNSLVDNKVIIEEINELIPNKKISELKRINLAINATNLVTGQTETFSKDNDLSIREAVLASSCIPILFASRSINNSYYVDGGVFNNTPLKDAIALGATHVFIVGLKPKEKAVYQKAIKTTGSYDSVFEVGTRLVELILDKVMYEDLKKARKLNKIIGLIQRMEASGDVDSLTSLKEAIEYEKNGKVKSIIEFYDIAPSARLDPPGVIGFEQKEAIQNIMEMGEQDARDQLKSVLINWETASVG